MSSPSDVMFPGGTLVTRLRVYDTLAPDGQRGGTPHVHLLCTELYLTLQGAGQVELLDASGPSTVDLSPGSALVFTPGTIHRLLNPNRDLEILVIMANNGLPENGDNTPTFPEHVLSNPDDFARKMVAHTLADAYRRRDLAVEGYLALKAAFEQSQQAGQAALNAFYEHAAYLMQPHIESWRTVVAEGPLAAAQHSLHHLTALQTTQTDYLHQAQHATVVPDATERIGFCGHLSPYPAP